MALVSRRSLDHRHGRPSAAEILDPLADAMRQTRIGAPPAAAGR